MLRWKSWKEGRPSRAAFVILLTVLLLSDGGARAGETDRFGFRPASGERSSFRLDLEPGAAVRDAALVFNKTSRRIRIRIYGADANESPDGRLSVPALGEPPKELGRWIKPDVDQITLGPNKSAVVGFAVVVPIGASRPFGAGALVASEIRERTEGGGIDIDVRVALAIRASDNPGESPPPLLLEDVSLDAPLRLLPASATVRAVVINGTSLTHEAKVSAQVLTLTGRVHELRSSDVSLGPGEKTQIEIPWTAVPLTGGVMRPRVKVEIEGISVSQTGPRRPVLPLWLLVLVLLAEASYLGLRQSRRRATG